jgi:alkanesulfonate monooxygenase SsuD/methylene tetrahydromethanopterin reductase-like flavin-dependent oxidoreductase (luciferase family)
MQISEPQRSSEARLFHDCLEQAVFADELGYACIWEVEHHGLYEYSHSSAPEIFLSFVAARTKKIRLGHGVTLLPNRYNHPIRIAERIATLDILSNGRVNWGTGKSSSLVEQQAFECDVAALHDEWREAVEIIPQMWAKEVFSYDGRFYKIPPTQIIPKPAQSPHPPIFAACSRPESSAAVGKLGLGALNFAFGSDDYLTDKVKQYRQAIAGAKPTNYQINNHIACTPATLVLEDDRKACRYGMRGARFFLESLSRYYFSGTRPVGKLDVPREFFPDDELTQAMAQRNTPGSEMAMIIGDPACCREAVQRFADAGVDELILVMQMGTVPQELIMESLRTFAEKVMPYFV